MSARSGAGVPDPRHSLPPSAQLQFAFGSRVWSPDGYGRHHSALTLSTAAPAPATAAAAGQQQGLPSPPAPTPPPTPSSGPAGAQSRPAASSVLGFMRPGSGVEVLPISRCELQDDLSNRLLAAVREGCERHRLLPHDDPGGQVCVKVLIAGPPRPDTAHVVKLLCTPASETRVEAQPCRHTRTQSMQHHLLP